GKKRPQRLAAVVRDPTQVFGQAARNRDEDNLRNFVWMKRTKFFLKRRLSIFADLKENQCLVASFDFALPAINRFNRWQNVPAGHELFGDELIYDALCRPAIRKRAQREQNLVRHQAGINASLRLAGSALQIQPPPTTMSLS